VVPLRSVPTLVFRPSQDIAAITSKFIQEDLGETNIRAINRALIRMLSRAGGGHPAALASILLLDGRLAARLIALGRQDAHAASERILAFFAGD
jgi:NTE family protein